MQINISDSSPSSPHKPSVLLKDVVVPSLTGTKAHPIIEESMTLILFIVVTLAGLCGGDRTDPSCVRYDIGIDIGIGMVYWYDI